jgi:hypothetical protein
MPDTVYLIAQGIGFIAFFCGISAFFQKDDRTLKVLMVFQGLLLAAHFYMLGALAGAGGALISGTRTGFSLFHIGKFIAPVFYIAAIIIGFAAYQSPVDILPILGSIAGTTAFFYLSGLKMRCLLAVGTILWIIHNALVLSIGPFLMEVFMLSANIYRLRLLLKERKEVIPFSQNPPG